MLRERLSRAKLVEFFAQLPPCLLDLEQRIDALAEASPAARRLVQVSSIGPLTATAVLATASTAHEFDHPRQFAAWLGLTPRQHSSGRSLRLGRITKRGNAYLRTLLVHGARSGVRRGAQRSEAVRDSGAVASVLAGER